MRIFNNALRYYYYTDNQDQLDELALQINFY